MLHVPGTLERFAGGAAASTFLGFEYIHVDPTCRSTCTCTGTSAIFVPVHMWPSDQETLLAGRKGPGNSPNCLAENC